jgi:hypothetical protein
MGHWLDGLLGGILIRDEGEELAVRSHINLVGFTVTDNAEGDEIIIETSGGGGGELDGDVEGPAGANRIGSISGDEDDVEVLIGCAMRFQPHTIAHNETLTPPSTLVYVPASEGEPTYVKLPEPAAGRTFVLIMTAAVGQMSLRRFGSEMINGVAGALSVDAPAMLVVVCDGTDWAVGKMALP